MHNAYKPGAGISGIWRSRFRKFLLCGKLIHEFPILGNPIPEFPTLWNAELGNSCIDFADSGHSGFLKSQSGMSEIPDYFRFSGAVVQHWWELVRFQRSNFCSCSQELCRNALNSQKLVIGTGFQNSAAIPDEVISLWSSSGSTYGPNAHIYQINTRLLCM